MQEEAWSASQRVVDESEPEEASMRHVVMMPDKVEIYFNVLRALVKRLVRVNINGGLIIAKQDGFRRLRDA